MRDRRAFFKTLAAAGAATIVPRGVFGQQSVVKRNVKGGAKDVHHHFALPGQTAGGPAREVWTPERSLEQVDKFGIAVAILSMTQNGATLVQKHPKQFGQMGGVPLPDLEGTLREIEYAYDTLKVDAIGIYTNDNKADGPERELPWPMAAMRAFMPESQILFGTDFSPESIESTVNELPGLKLPREFEQMMLRGNAERLFPRFKA